MKKVLIIIAVFVFAFSAITLATEARLQSLGLENQSWMTQDLATCFVLPDQIVNYGNIADIEIVPAITNNIGGAVTFNLGSGVLALANVPYTGALISVLPGATFFDAAALMPIHQTILGYGLNFGGATGALGIVYGSQATNVQNGPVTGDSAKTNTDSGLQNFAVLLGFGLPSDSPIDIGLSVGLPGGSYSFQAKNNAGQYYSALGMATDNNSESVGGVELGIDGRLGLGSLLTNLGINLTNLQDTQNTLTYAAAGGNKTGDEQLVTSLSSLDLNLGAAQTVKPSDNTDIILGAVLNFSTYSLTSKETDKMTNQIDAPQTFDSGNAFRIPIYAAAEAKLNSTFTVRAGLGGAIYEIGTSETKTESATGQTTADDTYNSVGNDANLIGTITASTMPTGALGLGVKINDVSIDACISAQLLLNGPYFITGNVSNFASQVALSYAWK